MAVGDILREFWAEDFCPIPSSSCVYDERGGTYFYFPLIRFDASTVEEVMLFSFMPPNYTAASSVTLRIWGVALTSTAADPVKFKVAITPFVSGTTDIDSISLGTLVTGTWTAPGTSAGILKYADVTLTTSDMGSIAAGAMFGLYFQRFASDAGDTMTGDFGLIAIAMLQG